MERGLPWDVKWLQDFSCGQTPPNLRSEVVVFLVKLKPPFLWVKHGETIWFLEKCLNQPVFEAEPTVSKDRGISHKNVPSTQLYAWFLDEKTK
jgi:hypothetical protein